MTPCALRRMYRNRPMATGLAVDFLYVARLDSSTRQDPVECRFRVAAAKPADHIFADADRLQIAHVLRPVRPELHHARVGQSRFHRSPSRSGSSRSRTCAELRGCDRRCHRRCHRPRAPQPAAWRPCALRARTAVPGPRERDAVRVDREWKRGSRSHIRSGVHAKIQAACPHISPVAHSPKTQAFRAIRMHATGGAAVIEYVAREHLVPA